MSETDSNLEGNWMDEISTNAPKTLKISDGEDATFIFKSEGTKKDHKDYGKSVVFSVDVILMNKIIEGAKMTITPKLEESNRSWYVKSNNFDLLGQIKELAKANNGKLTNLTVTLSRKGSKKSDTRYTIKKFEEPNQDKK